MDGPNEVGWRVFPPNLRTCGNLGRDEPMKLLGRWFAGLISDRFFRSVGILVGGTAAAHLITMATLPIATRLYRPADFAILAFVTSASSIISAAACLRFDIAIPIPRDDREAVNCLALAIFWTVVTTLLLAVLAVMMSGQIAQLFHRSDYAPYLWLVPVMVCSMGVYSSLQYWFVRRGQFSTIASNRVLQTSSSAATQIILGMSQFAPTGLLLGVAANWLVGSVGLSVRFLRRDTSLLSTVSRSMMVNVFIAQRRFPIFSAPEALLNSASIFVPIVFISIFANGPESGFIMLAMQVMQAPMALVGSAVANVYFAEAPAQFRANRLGEFTDQIFSRLLRSGVGPLAFAGFVAPVTFSLIFGTEWTRAGELVSWMTPWFIMQFLSSPLSTSLLVTSHQSTAFVLQLFGFIVRIGAVLAAFLTAPSLVGEVYALSGLLFYAVYLVVVLAIASNGIRSLRREFVRSTPIVLSWILAGFAANVALATLFSLRG